MSSKSYGDASARASEALDLVPNHQQAVMSMALASKEQGRLGAACELLRRAVQQGGEATTTALVYLSECRLRMGDDGEAVEALRAAVERENRVGGKAWRALVKCYDVLGQHGKANEMKVREGIGNTGNLRKRAVEMLKSL